MRARKNHLKIYIPAVVVVSFLIGVTLLLVPPIHTNTVYPRVFLVSENETVRSVAEKLAYEEIIDSPTLFILSSYLWGGSVIKGSYHLKEPKSVFWRAHDFYYGRKDAEPTRITVQEGSDVYAIAERIVQAFPAFEKEKFIKLALEEHGYLYPDTYLFAPDEIPSPELVISRMLETFDRRAGDLLDTYRGPYSEYDILTLASIVELEASKRADRKKIASVLYNRLDEGMPLQVDVSFIFINGKNTFTLSREDLKIDDPSNTYIHQGIPPIAIGNPTRESIEATINPAETDFFYFLADMRGVTHFSKTFEEHVFKKTTYLSNL